MLHTIAVAGLLACAIGGVVNAEELADTLRAEMQQRNNNLVQQGFNLTNGFSLGGARSKVTHMPREVRAPFLLAAPNNTGFTTTDPELLAASGACTAASNADLADHLGMPIIVPLFPRPSVSGVEENLYLHALTRASLLTQLPEYARVDLQFIAMLDDAVSTLADQGMKVSRRILMTGFSASGSFVSRFAMLHPDRVLAVAAGSPGGWPVAPVTKDGGLMLPSSRYCRLEVFDRQGSLWTFTQTSGLVFLFRR